MGKLPGVAWVCITLVVIAILGSLTYLSAIEAPTIEIRQFMNTLANYAGLVLGGVGALGGAVAAVESRKAARQTNGGLDDRVRAIVREENR